MRIEKSLKFCKVMRLAAIISVAFCLEAFSAARESVTGDLYVDAATGSDTNSGRSWDAAFASIQKAIDVAVAGETIVVNDGTYQPIISSDKKITIRSVNGAAVTIVDGGGLKRCATLGSSYTHDATEVIGFTLRNGYANKENGGGVCYGTVRDCVITNCSAIGNATSDGVPISGSGGEGGGAYCSAMSNCVVKCNNCTGNGGGISLRYSGRTAYSCFVSDNTAGNGGGVYGNMINCVIVRNRARWYGGGSIASELVNCTVYANRARKGGGCTNGRAVNCIIWGNSGGSIDFTDCHYSCVSSASGVGNFSADPVFVDAAKDDFRLKENSPCIDVGFVEVSYSSGVTTDADGASRYQGLGVDVGAYEYEASPYQVDREPMEMFVDSVNGDDSNAGDSPEHAKKTISGALRVAKNGDELKVYPGVYGPIITFGLDVDICSVGDMTNTVIDGASTYRCATLGEYSGTHARLSGFTLRNGRASYNSYYSYSGKGGGAVFGRLVQCILTNNVSTGESGWSSSGEGGGAYKCDLDRCELVGNRTSGCGGAASDCTLRNCLIASNSSSYIGGGTYYGELMNCTIVKNRAADRAGGTFGGIVNNCVVWTNSATQYPNVYMTGYYMSESKYTCTEPLQPGIGNISLDPKFVDCDGGNYRLMHDSPCINVGCNDFDIGDEDLDENPRCADDCVDLGAYEYQPHYVVFDVGEHGERIGGGALLQSVADGGFCVAPILVTEVGWKFLGWDKDFTCVTQDMVVTALYEEKHCTITMTNPYGNPVCEVVGHGTNYTFVAPSPYVVEAGVREYACCGTSFTAPTIKTTFSKVITNDLAFTWDVWITNAVYEVAANKPVKINEEWTKTYFGAIFEKLTKDAQITMLNQTMGNGFTAWQNYVIGLDPTEADSKVELDAPQSQSADKIEIVLENVLPPPGSGYEVKIEAEKDGKKIPGGTTFSIDLNSAGDPTGLYEFTISLVADGSSDASVSKTLSQTVGVLKGVSSKVKTAIAVPWDAMSGAGVHSISISNIVKTASLDIGDKLYVYDKSGKKYETWELGLDKTWNPVATYVVNEDGTISKTSAGTPESTEVARGSAIWLERQDVTKPYYLYGQFNEGTVSTTIDAGTADEPMWNLVASPLLEAFDLADIPLSDGVSAGAKDGDEIILSTENGPRTYTLKSGQWGYDVNTVEQRTMPDGTKIDVAVKTRNTSDATIPVGAGFWYVSHGGNPVIAW